VKFTIRKNNNAAIPEYLNDLCLYSILDKIWIPVQVNGTIPQARYGHQVLLFF